MPAKRHHLLLYAILIVVCSVVGWLQSRGQQSPSSAKVIPTAISTLEPASLNDAPVKQWSAQWASADCSAKQEVLLSHWLAREPKALLEFLRRMPPVSFLGQKEWENNALLAWAEREPQAAYRFSCMHQDEFGLENRILVRCLERDLEEGLVIIAGPELRGHYRGRQEEDFKWIEQNPEMICKRLSSLNTEASGEFYGTAWELWFKQNPIEAAKFANERGGSVLDEMISTLGFEAVAEQVAKQKSGGHDWGLMTEWGRKDLVAATAWAVENLPPARLKDAIDCLRQNVLSDEGKNNAGEYWNSEQLPALLQSLTPEAWHFLAGDENNFSSVIPVAFGRKIIGQAPDWMLPDLVRALPLKLKDLAEPDKLPEWFTSLTPERADAVVRMKRAGARAPGDADH